MWTFPLLLLPTAALHGLHSLGQLKESSSWSDGGDALSIVENRHGDYLTVMSAVVQAIGLSYNTSEGPDFQPSQVNATISSSAGENWERLFNFDLDPIPGGVHARVFADRANRRAIIAFRGSCLEPTVEQCRLDACFLTEIKGFGALSSVVYKTNESECKTYESHLDYVEQADKFVKAVQVELPDYKLLLTGHSMGGMLAMVIAATQPRVLQAITFAPSPFHETLLAQLGWQEAQIAALPAEDLIAACDPYDCGINSLYVDQARLGATTCLYFGTIEPSACANVSVQPYAHESWKSELQADDLELSKIRANLECKASAHEWSRYEHFVLRTNSDGSPAALPTCEKTFSVVQDSSIANDHAAVA